MSGGLTSRCTLSPLLKSWAVKVFFVPRETAMHAAFGGFYGGKNVSGEAAAEWKRPARGRRRPRLGSIRPSLQVDGVDERKV